MFVLTLVAAAASKAPLDPDLASTYAAARSSGSFQCLASGTSIPAAHVLDDFCDCPDGSDEPGSAACAGQVTHEQPAHFYCKNEGHVPQRLNVAFVNDGVCDCCDGSDEFAAATFHHPKGARQTSCPHECGELAASHAKATAEAEERRRLGMEAKRALIADGAAALAALKAEQEEKGAAVERLDVELAAARAALQVEEAAEAAERAAMKSAAALFSERFADGSAAPGAWEPFEAVEVVADPQGGERGSVIHVTDCGAVAVSAALALPAAPSAEGADPPPVRQVRVMFDYLASREMGALSGTAVGVQCGVGAAAPRVWLAGNEALAHGDTIVRDLDDGDGAWHTASFVFAPADVAWPGGASAAACAADIRVVVGALPPAEGAPCGVYADNILVVESTGDEAHDAAAGTAAHSRPERVAAQQAVDSLASAASTARARVQEIREVLAKDYGPDGVLYALASGPCATVDEREYTYEVCPFRAAHQRQRGQQHGGTRLGDFHEWAREGDYGAWGTGASLEAYKMMAFDRGDHCYNGPQRSIRVRLVCGPKLELVDIDEPSMCVYTARMHTPLMCE